MSKKKEGNSVSNDTGAPVFNTKPKYVYLDKFERVTVKHENNIDRLFTGIDYCKDRINNHEDLINKMHVRLNDTQRFNVFMSLVTVSLLVLLLIIYFV